ncbi:hypothetical protein ROZALSC1DRAFT_30657 [Rozella allomycis CSF55]|uniref:Uncharacterized protein n=1 Tax=Rozella allomycis (strain CSF55) TaxID=988480 RepID=A0A4P9YF45_ROZAC|nr:hypothetical protein ROZALSC1DRAFT_30657 [Rozella allomycis CSF55]
MGQYRKSFVILNPGRMKYFVLWTTCAYFFSAFALCEDLRKYETLKDRLADEISKGKIEYLPFYDEPLFTPVDGLTDFFKLLVRDNEVELVKGITEHAYDLLFSWNHASESIFTFALKEKRFEIFKILVNAVKKEHMKFIDVKVTTTDSLIATAVSLKKFEYLDYLVSNNFFNIADIEAALDVVDVNQSVSLIAELFGYEIVENNDSSETNIANIREAITSGHQIYSRLRKHTDSLPNMLKPKAQQVRTIDGPPAVNKYRSLAPLKTYEHSMHDLVDISKLSVYTAWKTVLEVVKNMITPSQLLTGTTADNLNTYVMNISRDNKILANAIFYALFGPGSSLLGLDNEFQKIYRVFKNHFTNISAKHLLLLLTHNGCHNLIASFQLKVIELLLCDFPDSHYILAQHITDTWEKYSKERLLPYLALLQRHLDINDSKVKHVSRKLIAYLFSKERFDLLHIIMSSGYAPLDLPLTNYFNVAQQLIVSAEAKDIIFELYKIDTIKENFKRALFGNLNLSSDKLRSTLCNGKVDLEVITLFIALVPEELERLNSSGETIENTCETNRIIFKYFVDEKKRRGIKPIPQRYEDRNGYITLMMPYTGTPLNQIDDKEFYFPTYNYEKYVRLESGQVVEHLPYLIEQRQEDLIRYYIRVISDDSLLDPRRSYLSDAVINGDLNLVKLLVGSNNDERYFSFFLSSKELPNHLVYQIIELRRIEILNYLMDMGVIKEETLFACLQTFKDRQKVVEFLKEVQSVASPFLEYVSAVQSEVSFDKMSTVLLDSLNSKKLLLPLKPKLLPQLFFSNDKNENSIKSVLDPLFNKRKNRMVMVKEILGENPEIFYTEAIFFHMVKKDIQLLKFVLENTKEFHVYLQNLYLEDSNTKQSYFEKVLSINPHLISILVNSGAFPLSFRLNSSFNVAQRILVSDVYNSLRNYNQDEVREALTQVSLGMNFSLKMYFEAAREIYDEDFVKYLVNLERTSVLRKDYYGDDIFAYCEKNSFVRKQTVDFMTKMMKRYFKVVHANLSWEKLY